MSLLSSKVSYGFLHPEYELKINIFHVVYRDMYELVQKKMLPLHLTSPLLLLCAPAFIQF